MKKTDKARKLALIGISMHLEGFSLKETYKYFERQFEVMNMIEKDRALVKYLILTTIRNRGIIESIMMKYLNKPIRKKFLEPKSGIMLGITQILFTRMPSYASVNSVVELFHGNKRIWKPLINALLRKAASEKKNLQAKTNNKIINIPSWLKTSWLKQYGKNKTNKIINSIYFEPVIDLKLKYLKQENIKIHNAKLILEDTLRLSTQGDIKKITGYKEGEWWVQDIAAQLPVKIMGTIKDKNIVEFCGAPGGKTAQMLQGGANVISIEVSKKRSKILRKNIERLKLKNNLKIILCDATKWIPRNKSEITILDVPCSSTGTLRKNPDVMWQKNEEDIVKLSIMQKSLLHSAINITETNGTIIYCCCSMQFEEGEKIIDYFLNKKKVKLINIKREEIKGYPFSIINKGLVRTLPYMYNDIGGMDGFFIAKLKRI